MKISDNISNCLYERRPPMTSDEDIIYRENYQGKFHLAATDTMETCLDASVQKRLSASERRRTSLSSCKWNANQMWSLNDNGTLVNSYSGLCAIVEPMKENVNSDGVRSWIATGRRVTAILGNHQVAMDSCNQVKLLSVKESVLVCPCKLNTGELS
ncbi:uncharacterized protein A4U43_C09F11910, partial [Asparagus officinalis]